MRPEDRGKRVGEVVGEMGRERRALRAKKTAVVLLWASSFVCLLSALFSLAGYLPYAAGPSVVLIIASVVGFAAGAFESSRP